MEIKQPIIDYFSNREDILSVYLFGSIVSGKADKKSDVDIAVFLRKDVRKEDYAEKIILMTDELSRILDKEIDIVVLNNANTFLKFQIIKNGVRLLECERIDNRRFEASAIIEYLDFLPIRRKMEESLINYIKKGA